MRGLLPVHLNFDAIVGYGALIWYKAAESRRRITRDRAEGQSTEL